MKVSKFEEYFTSMRAQARILVKEVPPPSMTEEEARSLRHSCECGLSGVPRASWPKVGGPEWQLATRADRTRDLMDLANCADTAQFKMEWWGAGGATVGDRPYKYAESLISHFSALLAGT